MPDAAKQVLVEIKTTADTAAVAQESAALEELRTKLADANAELKTWNDLNRKGIADEGGPLDQRIKASAEEVENLTAKLREAEQAQKDLNSAGEKAGEATAAAADKAGVSLNALGFAQGLVIAHWRRIITWAGEAGTAIGTAIFRPTNWAQLQKDIEKTEEHLRKVVDEVNKIGTAYQSWLDKQLESEHSLDHQLETLKQMEASEERTAKRQADIRNAEHEYNAEEIKRAEDKGEISHTEAEERRQQLEFEKSSAENNAKQDANIRKITAAKQEQAAIEAEGRRLAALPAEADAREQASKLIGDAEAAEMPLRTRRLDAFKGKEAADAEVKQYESHHGELADTPIAQERYKAGLDELIKKQKEATDAFAESTAKLKEATSDRAALQQAFPGVTSDRVAEAKKADDLRKQSITGLEKGAKQYDAAQTRINEAQADAARDEVVDAFKGNTQDLRNQDALGKAQQKDQEAVLKKAETSSKGDESTAAASLKQASGDFKNTEHQITDAVKSVEQGLKAQGTEGKQAAEQLKHATESLSHNATADQLRASADAIKELAGHMDNATKAQLKAVYDLIQIAITQKTSMEQLLSQVSQLKAEVKSLSTQINQTTHGS